MDVAEPREPGRALSHDMASRSDEAAEDQIRTFIERRHAKRVEEEGEFSEEAWKESVRVFHEKRRQQARLEWHAYHCDQADRHRRNLEALIADHKQRAEQLMDTPEDAA